MSCSSRRRFCMSLLLSLVLVASSPRPAQCFLNDLFRDLGEGIFDAIVGLKRAVGLNDIADQLEENFKNNKRCEALYLQFFTPIY